MNVAENWRNRRWNYSLQKDWSRVPNNNRPYELREEEKSEEAHDGIDLTFPAAAMISISEEA